MKVEYNFSNMLLNYVRETACPLFHFCSPTQLLFVWSFQLDVENVHHLLYLLKWRENDLFNDLRKKMASAVVFTKVWPVYLYLLKVDFGSRLNRSWAQFPLCGGFFYLLSSHQSGGFILIQVSLVQHWNTCCGLWIFGLVIVRLKRTEFVAQWQSTRLLI